MGKRSNFKRRKQDKYYTPLEAVVPLIPHIANVDSFIEPCAGDGRLITHLNTLGVKNCLYAGDIAPPKNQTAITRQDALKLDHTYGASHIITNPAWTRVILHKMIEHFRQLAPTWLLFDADWAHTQQSEPYMRHCHKVVSVGRIKWIEGTKHKSKDSGAWYLFTNEQNQGYAPFYGRKKT